MFPEYQAIFRRNIEEILWKPFITVKAANERIKQSKIYGELLINNVKYNKQFSWEVMSAANNEEYKSLDAA
jgi:hypothetical protein